MKRFCIAILLQTEPLIPVVSVWVVHHRLPQIRRQVRGHLRRPRLAVSSRLLVHLALLEARGLLSLHFSPLSPDQCVDVELIFVQHRRAVLMVHPTCLPFQRIPVPVANMIPPIFWRQTHQLVVLKLARQRDPVEQPVVAEALPIEHVLQQPAEVLETISLRTNYAGFFLWLPWVYPYRVLLGTMKNPTGS